MISGFEITTKYDGVKSTKVMFPLRRSQKNYNNEAGCVWNNIFAKLLTNQGSYNAVSLMVSKVSNLETST